MRTTDLTGNTGWAAVSSTAVSGSSINVTLYDTPTATGTYLYGAQLADNVGNTGHEPSTIQVAIASSAQVPTATTTSATSVTTSSATINGTVNPNGTDTQVWFLYGTSSSLSGATQTSSYDLGSGTSASGLQANLTVLSPGTSYYFRIVAQNSSGTTNGSILSFTTAAAAQAPTATTGSASSIATNSATLGGTVNPNGADTHFWFLYGASSTLSGATQTPSQDLGSGPACFGNQCQHRFFERRYALLLQSCCPEQYRHNQRGHRQLHHDRCRAGTDGDLRLGNFRNDQFCNSGGDGKPERSRHCQGRSETLPVWRSKSRPLDKQEVEGFAGSVASGA